MMKLSLPKLPPLSVDAIRTLVAVAAIGMIGAGAGMISMPAGLIVSGALLLAGCVAGALRSN
jgi:hypothetical protein